MYYSGNYLYYNGVIDNQYIKSLIKSNKILLPKQLNILTNKTMDFIYNTYISLLKNNKPLSFKNSSLNWKLKIWDTLSYKTLISIKNKTKIDFIIIDAYFRVMIQAITLGKLSYKLIDPIGYKADTDLKKEIVGKNTVDFIKDIGTKTETITKMLLVTGSILGIGYILNKIKE